jgi:hypothetical protein
MDQLVSVFSVAVTVCTLLALCVAKCVHCGSYNEGPDEYANQSRGGLMCRTDAALRNLLVATRPLIMNVQSPDQRFKSKASMHWREFD